MAITIRVNTVLCDKYILPGREQILIGGIASNGAFGYHFSESSTRTFPTSESEKPSG